MHYRIGEWTYERWNLRNLHSGSMCCIKLKLWRADWSFCTPLLSFMSLSSLLLFIFLKLIPASWLYCMNDQCPPPESRLKYLIFLMDCQEILPFYGSNPIYPSTFPLTTAEVDISSVGCISTRFCHSCPSQDERIKNCMLSKTLSMTLQVH